jgi:hypothetical protein
MTTIEQNSSLYDGKEDYDDQGVLCRYTEEDGWVPVDGWEVDLVGKEEEEEDEEEEVDFSDCCDCCVKGWSVENEFGRCECMCDNCYGDYRDCKGECEKIDFSDRCDGCVKGWSVENEFGRCECMCSHCYGYYRDCKGECVTEK